MYFRAEVGNGGEKVDLLNLPPCLIQMLNAHLTPVLHFFSSAFAPIPFSACLSFHREVQVMEKLGCFTIQPYPLLVWPEPGLIWSPCCAALSGATKESCPENRSWARTETLVDTAGHTESRCAIKYAGTCPSVHPGSKWPGQRVARRSEKPHLGSCMPVLSCTPWSTRRRELLFILWARNTHFYAISTFCTHLSLPLWDWMLSVTRDGAELSCSNLCRQGERYVCPAWTFW